MTIQELNPHTTEILSSNVKAVKANIERIKEQNGIDRDVIMLAATKTVPAEVINYVTQELGVRYIGENRVQELLQKYDKLDLTNVELHFIGKLQTNKVKYIIDKVDMIHSVDSLKLAKEIDQRAKKIGKVMNVLVEINSGREENKSGLFPEEVPVFLEQIVQFDNICVKGLMTIAPVCEEKEDYRKYFAETYSIFIDNLQNKIHNICMDFMSMGMTDSYDVAIEEGSNVVRIGSAIFGSRY
jgi:pyridoxal phosphate enzyme (YggS family)